MTMKKTPLASIALLALVVAASPLAANAEESVQVDTSARVEVSGGRDQKPERGGIFNDLKLRLEGRAEKDKDKNKGEGFRNGSGTPDRHASSTRPNEGEKGQTIEQVKARATAQIDKRIGHMNEQIARIAKMERLSAEQKASITAELTAQVTALTALKAKIAAETDIAAVREDMKSITKEFRVHAVTMPKAAITAAADRIMSIVAKMETFSAKLSERVTAANSAEATAAFADFTAKIGDAKVQAQAAASLVANLQADNGDATIAASNAAAIKSAKEKIDAAREDLKAARKDIGIILKEVKGIRQGTDS